MVKFMFLVKWRWLEHVKGTIHKSFILSRYGVQLHEDNGKLSVRNPTNTDYAPVVTKEILLKAGTKLLTLNAASIPNDTSFTINPENGFSVSPATPTNAGILKISQPDSDPVVYLTSQTYTRSEIDDLVANSGGSVSPASPTVAGKVKIAEVSDDPVVPLASTVNALLATKVNSADLGTSVVRDTGVLQNEIPLIGVGNTLSVAVIPNLDANKIISGVLAATRIPALDANKITSGVLDRSRISASTPIDGQILSFNSATGTITWINPPTGGGGNVGLASVTTTGTVKTNVNESDPVVPTLVTFNDAIAAINTTLTSKTNNVDLGTASTRNTGVVDGTIPLISTGNFITASIVPTLDATKIGTGVLDIARIPDIAANKVTSGVFDITRIPNLDANKITTSVFNIARIPDLDATKITTGAFNIARIPNLDANKITTGTLSPSRISSVTPTNGQLLAYETATSSIVWVNPPSSPSLASTSTSGTVKTNVNEAEPVVVALSTFNSTITTINTTLTSKANSADLGTASTRNIGSLQNNIPVIGAGNKLEVAIIPDLNASKTTSGVFTSALIPSLDASKITSGVFDRSRISASTPTDGQILSFNSGTNALVWVNPPSGGGSVGLASTTTSGTVKTDTNESDPVVPTLITFNNVVATINTTLAAKVNSADLGTASVRNTGLLENNVPIIGTGNKLDVAIIPNIPFAKVQDVQVTWGDLIGIPNRFPSELHTHIPNEIEGLGTVVTRNVGNLEGNVALVEAFDKLNISVIPDLPVSKITGITDRVTVDSTVLNFNNTSPVMMFTLRANTILQRIQVIIDTAFNNTPVATIGITGNTSKYVKANEIDLTLPARTVFEVPVNQFPVADENLILTYTAGGATVGSARVLVTYVLPS